MEKLFIQNRKGQKICVVLEKAEAQKGLAFVMHGLSGYKEELHIQVFADAFREHGFTVVRFDTTNTFGESDGDYADATVTNYYEDLEDVIKWSSKQAWYQEPFVLAGHSLGGICIIHYAEQYPEKIKGLAPISTVVSGKLSTEMPKHRDFVEEWEKTGWRIEESSRGIIKKLKWSHMEDRLKYDVLPEAHKLAMPVLLIVGDKDESTPPEHQQMLLDKVSGEKEMHIVEGATHTFPEENQRVQVRKFFDQWIERYFV